MTFDEPFMPYIFTENGLPAAFIERENDTHYFVYCPFCRNVHRHAKPDLGSRTPHCSHKYRGILEYELVRPLKRLGSGV